MSSVPSIAPAATRYPHHAAGAKLPAMTALIAEVTEMRSTPTPED
jgi:hypothetical protein